MLPGHARCGSLRAYAHERSFRQIARGLAAYLEGCDRCGYNIWSFDLKVLVAEFRQAEVPFSAQGRQIIDPLRIYRGLLLLD
jgi:DNA polymerase-3 subunit epsilon